MNFDHWPEIALKCLAFQAWTPGLGALCCSCIVDIETSTKKLTLDPGKVLFQNSISLFMYLEKDGGAVQSSTVLNALLRLIFFSFYVACPGNS